MSSGVAKVGHMPHQLSVVPHLEKFGNSNHDIIQANSNYLLSSNIPKSFITLISFVSNGNMLDHKFQQCILVVWNIPSNCGLKFEDSYLPPNSQFAITVLATIYLSISWDGLMPATEQKHIFPSKNACEVSSQMRID